MAFRSSTSWALQVLGKVPLRTILVVPFVLQIFAVVGLTGWLSLRNGKIAVNDVAMQLRNEIITRIQQRLDTYLATPHLINQINAEAMRSGKLNTNDPPSERYLWQQIQFFPSVSWIYVSTPQQGAFLGVTRLNKERSLQLVVSDNSTGYTSYFYSTDSQGDRAAVGKIGRKNYDARIRPFYTAALKAGKATWSEIYPDYSAADLLNISASEPVYDKSGKLLGVSSSDLYLDDISKFLRSIKIGRSGQTFIVERSGLLVANSILESPFIFNRDRTDAKRIKALDSSDGLIRSTAQHLNQYFGDLSKINASTQLDFMLDGKRQFVQVVPYRDSRGLDWLLVVVIPEADFMGRINENTRTTVLLCLAALVIAALLGILTARWISTPILRLSEASKALAAGKLEQPVKVKGVNELGVLAQSFNRMAVQLRDSFAALEQANEELEQRVHERTSELKTANQEITLLNNRLKAENLRMSAELEVTRRLQQMLLPKEPELNQIAGLDIAGFMEPAAEIGGDYYDVLNHKGQVKIGIGDVTGHGLESGVLMIMVQTAVRTLLASEETDLVKFWEVLNQTIYDNVQRMNSDKNLTLSLLDYQSGQLRLSGQHEEMILVRSGEVERIDTIDLGFPVGLEANISDFVAQTSVQLNSGDVVVLYTDGITEAENLDGVQYTIERLCEVVKHNWQHSANQIKQAVIDDVQQHIGEQKVYDDITLLVLKQK